MEEDNLPIPDDISSLEAELEFQELEKSIAEFNKGYDEPIDSRFLWNYIGGRQMGYGDDELQIIEDTAFSKIMDYMDENDLHYTEVDVYDFIPEDKRLSPYLIYKENIRNEYYTDDFVEYMTLVTRRTPSGIYDIKTDDILDAPPSHYMAEYALKGAAEQGPTVRLEVWSKIINGAVTDGFLKKLKFKDFFKKAYQRTQNRDLIIRHINNLFPGGSYEAYLEENHNRNMERMGFTPEGDWLPEIKEKMVIKYTDADGNVTYKDFYGNELDADDPRISDDSKFDDLVKQLEPSPEELTEEEKIKKLFDDGILTETEYQQALNKEGNWADTPTNVVDDVPTLNTDLVWRQDFEPIENIRNPISNTNQPRWRDGVVENNNILKPNLKRDDIKRILSQILDGTVSDIDFTRFGIWLLHKSPTPAYGSKSFNSSDALADVTKIVIFNGKSPIDLINQDTLEMVKNYITFDTGAFTTDITTGPNAGSKSMMGLSDELILQFGREEGPFANAQQRMKQTIINEHNKLYADADDYFILFRGGALTNDPIQSFSKDGFQAHSVGFQTNQKTIRQGRGIDGYFVNKNDFIDLHSLGLDAKGEKEVIVYKEGVSKPIQKTVMDESVRDFNYLDKNRLKFIEDNWVMMYDDFPKTGFINSIKPDDPTRNQTLRVMDDTPDATTASTRVQQVAFDFAKNYGLAEPNFNAIAYFNPEVGLEAADIYEGLPDFDDSAVPLYNTFIKETNAQYDALTNAGIQFELVDTDPYTPNAAGHKQMINDMQNGRLKVLATSSAGELPEGSPMGKVSKYTDVNGRQMLENDVFRAVHDTFGHGMRGNTFGPIGEYNAWLAHKEMYTPTSQRVMTTETLGQNTYVNFGPHMRTEEGALIGKGDSGYIKPQDRPFAPQKVAVMPDTIITKAGDVVTDATGLVNTNAMTKVRNFISNTPDAAESLWKATKFTLGKGFRGLQVLDPGDIAIEYGLARLLPRLGLGAIAAPALYAYVFYELAVLAVDAANGLQKAAEKQGIAGIGEDKDIDWKQLGKDTWSEMGEVSDDWSLSWKISEPIINSVFEEYGKMKAAKEEKDYFSNLETGLAPR